MSNELIHPIPLVTSLRDLTIRVLPFLLLDFFITGALWALSGLRMGVLDFLIASLTLSYSFTLSLMDLVAISLMRPWILLPVYWLIKTNLAPIFLSVVGVVVPAFSLIFTSIKLAHVFPTLNHLGIYELNLALISWNLGSSFLEFVLGIIAAWKVFQLQKIEHSNIEEEDEDQLLSVRMNTQSGVSHASIGRVLHLAIPELPLLFTGFFSLLVGSAATLAMPAYFGQIVNIISFVNTEEEIARAYQQLLNSVYALIFIFGVGGIFDFVRGWLFNLAGQRIVSRVRKILFRAITIKDISYFDENKTGELTNRLSSDTAVLQGSLTTNLSEVVRNLVQVIGSVVILFVLSWKLTLVMLSTVPIVSVVAVVYGKYIMGLRKKFQDELAVSIGTAEEALSNIRTVRSFSHEKRIQTKFASDIDNSYIIGKKLSISFGVFIGALTLFSQCAIILVVWYGGTLVVDRDLTPGTLLSFLMYTLTVAFTFASISSLLGDFMQAVGAAEKIFEIIDLVPIIPTEGGKYLSSVKGEIILRDVNFTYPTRKDTLALKGVNLKLKPGKIVALVGHSGGGKSTIASLIERFYDPDSGAVLLDGHDIRELNPGWYRSQIGYVAQEPVLFACSIKDNITFGNQNLSQEQVDFAAKQANAYEFIQEKGYDALVGERGVRLSGGQKQRIAIARALILNPKVLLLDEATSALDAQSEGEVQEAIDKAMQNRTVLVIAHRLSTVKKANKIVVINNGEIVDQGTHEELLEKGGIYRKLVNRQMLSETKEEVPLIM